MRKIKIFDTTLRDGEQSPGASMNLKEKLQVARVLAELNVDALEAGFPITSPDDFEAVKRIAKEIRGPIIAGLARAHPKDIEACAKAVSYSTKPRVHTFIATSDIHIEKKLRKTRAEVLDIAVDAVKLARRLIDDVEFSCEDASRSDFAFLSKIVEAVIAAGATTINIPDTVGYAMPQEFGELIRNLKKSVPNSSKATFSVHCHNDLGLAVANSLSAVLGGADQVECTINGIGERAGNAALEEIVMAMKVRPRIFDAVTNIDTRKIHLASRTVAALTGIHPQPNKAVVGANAFAHEAGIHQDGVLKDRMTYEIMRPEDVGIPSNQLVLGKHSGRHALAKRLGAMGYAVAESDIDEIYERFKKLADKKKVIFDDDLISLVDEKFAEMDEIYSLDSVSFSSGTKRVPSAVITLKKIKKKVRAGAKGDGPVDAVFGAIDKITGVKTALEDYAIKSVSSGKDAMGEVSVKLKHKGISYSGRGSSTDVIEASAKAYLNAVNKILAYGELKKSRASL
ncbi:MAG: 2-isopropylmalate synthase [Elusimicrobia bacterium HGW-Elusimicrobia-1]|jgi:2-isopropylmalate synthase|nr:MAG: 2-isopropylmalate synthase [Elusimicrobia bacterium HGW-Elusimicrobia-1]